jgi:hypothetical protein
LSLEGFRVTQICINERFVEITLNDSRSSIAFCISATFALSNGRRKLNLDPKEALNLDPLLKLINQHAMHIDMHQDGSIKLMLENGHSVTIPKDSLSDPLPGDGEAQPVTRVVSVVRQLDRA